MKTGVHRKAKGRGWVFRWVEIVGGKPKRRTSPEYRTRRLAEMALDGAEAPLEHHRNVRHAHRLGLALPWSVVLDRWSASRRTDDAVTVEYARTVVKSLTALATAQGWHTCADITADAVDQWRSQRGGTGRRLLSYLKSVLRYARRVLRQQFDDQVLELPVGSSRPRAPTLLTHEQVAGVISSAQTYGERFALLLDCLATYGWRPIDACRLIVADVDCEAGTLTHPTTKNGDAVNHPLLPNHVSSFKKLVCDRANADPLFTNRRGLAWTISKAGQAAELGVWYRRHPASHLPTADRGIYRLKDYAISIMDAAGIEDRTKADFTGHRDLRSLDHYKATNHVRAHAALALLKPIHGGRNGGMKVMGAEMGAG